MSSGQGLTQPLRVTELLLLLVESGIFDRIGQSGRREFLHLELEQRDLASSHPSISAERAELFFDSDQFRSRSAIGRQRVGRRRAGECVENAPLRGRLEKGLVRMLRVQIEEIHGAHGEFGGSGESPVDVGTAPTGGRHDAGQHHLGAGLILEPTFDACFGRAVAHNGGVGPLTGEERERTRHQRLAGTGLSRDRSESRPDEQVEFFDDAEVRDPEFEQHQRSAKPNLAFRIW